RLPVAKPQQAVFAPAVRTTASLIVREVVPAVALERVVLANGAPLPLRQVRAPPFPVLRSLLVLPQALRLGVRHLRSLGARLGHSRFLPEEPILADSIIASPPR